MSVGGPSTFAVVVAAGSGERLGLDQPKALARLAGRTLLDHALERLTASGVFAGIVVVHPPGDEAAFAEACRGYDVSALVPGGAQRTDSVRAGVAAVPEGTGRIAIHDAARCLTPSVVIARAVDAVGGDVVAAAPGVAVKDTLKRVAGGLVVGTVQRAGLWAVHTPQVIDADTFRTTLAWASGDVATDDLGLVERAIDAGAVEGRIVLVEGDTRDLKVTYPQDLVAAAQMLAAEQHAADAASAGAS